MAADALRTRESEPRQPRASGGKSLPTGRRPRFHLATLGAKTAAAIGIGAAAVIVLGGILLARTGKAVRDLERSQYAGIAADARVRLDRLVGRDRDRMMGVAFSDGLYELLARGAAAPDSFIRPAFAQQFPAQYGDRFVAIYDLGGRRLYAWADAGQAQLEAVATNPLFRVLDNREPAIGLVRQGEKLFWVAGAPVLPTNYTAPDQPIRGYVVVAQPFNPGWVGPAANGRVELAALKLAKEAFHTRVGPASTRDSVRVEFALPDIFAQQNTVAAITTSRTEFSLLENRLLWLAVIGALAIVALAGAGYLAATRFLVTPVARLAQALAPVHVGQSPGLIGSIAPAAEWTSVVQAVNRLVSNSRSFSDHFERLANVVTDGAWERNLGSGEWTVTSRFRELVGYQAGDFPTPLAALTARLHADDAALVLPWLEAEVPNPKTLAADVRVRRGNDVAWVRIEGELASDGVGVASRIIGRISDLAGVRRAEAQVEAAAQTIRDHRLVEGRFLAALAPHLSSDPAAAEQLAVVGQSMAGTLDTTAGPCDLYGLLQESAGAAELSIVPGLPERVEADRALLKSTIDLLVHSAAPGGRLVIGADQPDRSRPERIRISVEDRHPTDRDATAKIAAVLATGQSEDGDLLLSWRAVYHLAKTLGGEAGIRGDAAGTSRWIIVPLCPIAVAASSPSDDVALPAAPTWNAEESGAPFDLEPPLEPSPRPSRPSARVELVADATVTINLDDTAPIGAIATIGERFLATLQASDQTAQKLARVALAEIPARLTELTGAAKAGEIGAVIDGTASIIRIAEAIEATEVAARCRDIIDAAESQYLDSSDDLIARLDTAWRRLAEVLAPQPIEPAMLEQLNASLSDGGLGAQLVGLFLAEGPGRVEAIEEAAGRADWTAVKANAGDLKNMCALIGAEPLAARCGAAIEAVGSDAWTEALAIRTEWTRVHHVLDSLMGAQAGAVT